MVKEEFNMQRRQRGENNKMKAGGWFSRSSVVKTSWTVFLEIWVYAYAEAKETMRKSSSWGRKQLGEQTLRRKQGMHQKPRRMTLSETDAQSPETTGILVPENRGLILFVATHLGFGTVLDTYSNQINTCSIKMKQNHYYVIMTPNTTISKNLFLSFYL